MKQQPKVPKLPKAPKEGEGLHQWLLGMSRALLLDGLSRDEVVSALLETVQDSSRTTQDVETEIVNAVDGAVEFLESNPGFMGKGRMTGKVWTDPLSFAGLNDAMVRQDRRLARVTVNQRLVKWIKEKEAKFYKLGKGEQGFKFQGLFAGIDLDIAVCKEMYKPVIRRCSELELDLNCVNYQYIVPNSMWKSDLEGGTRSDFNVAERLFCVVEFDRYPHEYQWLAFNYLWRTGKFPLVMIVDSGGKSLHGWFACFGVSEFKVKSFCRLASSIGADKTTWSPSQWVRMPNGWNVRKKRFQHVVWLSIRNVIPQCTLMRKELL